MNKNYDIKMEILGETYMNEDMLIKIPQEIFKKIKIKKEEKLFLVTQENIIIGILRDKLFDDYLKNPTHSEYIDPSVLNTDIVSKAIINEEYLLEVDEESIKYCEIKPNEKLIIISQRDMLIGFLSEKNLKKLSFAVSSKIKEREQYLIETNNQIDNIINLEENNENGERLIDIIKNKGN